MELSILAVHLSPQMFKLLLAIITEDLETKKADQKLESKIDIANLRFKREQKQRFKSSKNSMRIWLICKEVLITEVLSS